MNTFATDQLGIAKAGETLGWPVISAGCTRNLAVEYAIPFRIGSKAIDAGGAFIS